MPKPLKGARRDPQIDLLDLIAAASAAESVHWLVAKTRSAATACGIAVSTYHRNERTALTIEGVSLRCTHDRSDGTVTCARCRRVLLA
jgi:hypothetical protein